MQGQAGVTALLLQMSRAIYRHTPESMLGMPLKEFAVLVILRDHGAASQQSMCEMMCVEANNMVLWLNDLEAAGHALRRRDPSDRRRHIVEITAGGLEALERAERAIEGVEDSVLAALDQEERRQLHHLLAKALEAPRS